MKTPLGHQVVPYPRLLYNLDGCGCVNSLLPQFQVTRTMSNDTLLIPGPIVISEKVQQALGSPSCSPTVPEFVNLFQGVLKNCRKLFRAHETQGQPIVLVGSGTLGWDVAAANLVDPEDEVLVIGTGYFSDSFQDCLELYGAKVDKLEAPLGDQVPFQEVEQQLKKKQYKAITITQVDTSTGVLSNVQRIAELVHELSPSTFIIVDGVCSIGCEEFEFDKWGIDFCLSASQKAIGAAPGLSISMISQRALEHALDPSRKPRSYYASLKKWIPVMQAYEDQKPKYFATLSVQMVKSLDVALKELLADGLELRWEKHRKTSEWLKKKLTDDLGFKLVTKYPSEAAAHGLTVFYVKDPPKLISYLKQHGTVITGGIHKQIASQCVRIGHMGVSVCSEQLDHIPACYKLIAESNIH